MRDQVHFYQIKNMDYSLWKSIIKADSERTTTLYLNQHSSGYSLCYGICFLGNDYEQGSISLYDNCLVGHAVVVSGESIHPYAIQY